MGTDLVDEETRDGLMPGGVDAPNIVPINDTVGAELEIQRKESERDMYKQRPCAGIHKRIVVHEKDRKIVCDACGWTVDAFDFILSWANEGSRLMRGLHDIRVQTRISRAEKDSLDRQIKNMRSTLKRGGCPQDPKERHDFDIKRWNPQTKFVVKEDSCG